MATITIDNDTVTGGGTAPDAPTSLTTESEWDGVRLHWTNPSQRDVDYIEVYRATTNNRSTATMVAEVKANDYMDHSLETGTRYYWVRARSNTGLFSDYHPTSATAGVSGTPEQVAITSAADKDVLQYDSATASWVNSHGLRAGTRLKGELQATTDDSYVFPSTPLTALSDNNGYSAASSISGNAGNAAFALYSHFDGDTASAANSAASLNLQNARGNSVTGVTLPWTGTLSVAPSASQSQDVLGTLNFNGYCTTDFGNRVGTFYQGGGINTLHGIQIQSYAAENFSDSTLTISAANITGISRVRAALTTPTVTGTKGQISFGATTLAVGQAIRVTGTLTGNATGIVSGQDYWIIATNGTTTAQLSATPGGLPIDTTGTTLTGLTLNRCVVTLTLTGQTKYPYGRNSILSVSGITNTTNGNYTVAGVPSLTSVALGIPHDATAPALSGSQSISSTVAYMASGVRIRAFPTATPANTSNRVSIFDHTVAAATYKADTITLQQGTSTTNHAVFDTTKASFVKPVAFPTMDTTTRNALTPSAGWVIFNTTTVKLECYDGATWQALF